MGGLPLPLHRLPAPAWPGSDAGPRLPPCPHERWPCCAAQLEARAVARLVTRKAVVAEEGESSSNPRSRSAKLRVLERR